MSENETDQEIEEQEPENNDEAKDSSETYQGIDQSVVKNNTEPLIIHAKNKKTSAA